LTAVDRAPRVALVTGGARGIGAAVVVALAGTGHDLAICDVCQPVEGMAYAMSGREELDGVAAEIVGLGRRCHTGAVDVRDLDAVERFVADTEAELGPITTVCANAGLSSPARPFWETAPEQWQTVLDVNLTGVWHVARAAAPAMIARGHGSIVVVASTNGRQAAGGGAGYTASKHGVLGLAKAMALELAPHGIRCNTVLPGRTETPLVGTAHGGVPCRPTAATRRCAA
jgi:NAD(P)-dependent dehydrogenase (short-subunit alcohol dehydrogenase family)